MKATKIFMMAALALTFAACSNDDNEFAQQPAEQPANGEITITATLDANDGATTRALGIDGSNIASTWEDTDEFAILFNDGSDNVKRTATVSSINGSSVTITFTIPQSLANNTACTIVYPALAANAANTGADVDAALATQGGTIETTPEVRVGTATIDKTNHSLSNVTKLVAQNAIFLFTTKNSSGSATIDVTSLTVSIGAKKYFITPTGATSTLYAALPAVSSQAVRFSVRGSDSKYYTCSKASATFAAGKYFQSTLKMTAFPNNCLPGEFTINANGGTVYFSKGNLQATTTDNGAHWTWSFATNQWDCVRANAANNAISGNGIVSTNGTVDLFGWSTNATNFGINNSTNVSDYSGDFVDWGTKIGSGWRTLTGGWKADAEWKYLLKTRSTASGARYAKAKVNNQAGIILLPDDWNTSNYALSNVNSSSSWYTNSISSANWATYFEAHGAVFLPAAGYRQGTTVSMYNDGRASYWSSSKSGDDSACQIYCSMTDNVSDYSTDYRYLGNSVRLVRNAN